MKAWLRSPLARIPLFIALALAVFFALRGWVPGIAALVAAAVVAYLVLVLAIERRRPGELAPRALLPGFALGFAGGTALIGGVMGVLWLAGAYQVSGFNDDVRWAQGLFATGLGAAVSEEIAFRGVLYRLVEERFGFRWALAVSALLFGALHFANPGATLWSCFAIAVEAGVLLGVVFHVTRSLWTCIGLHTAWNFLEGTVFGSAVSGSGGRHSLFAAQFSGPQWLTGGGFGIEASVLTVVLSLGASIALLAARRRPAADNGAMPAGASAC